MPGPNPFLIGLSAAASTWANGADTSAPAAPVPPSLPAPPDGGVSPWWKWSTLLFVGLTSVSWLRKGLARDPKPKRKKSHARSR